jgi:hypothetical protein
MINRGSWRLRALAAVCLLLLSGPPVTGATGGNGFYKVIVQHTGGGVGIGVYTVQTDTLHPLTGALGQQNVLFGGGMPGTSYTTIRSYTSGEDYAQRGDNSTLNISAGAPTTHFLESLVIPGLEAVPVGDPNNPAGFTTTYDTSIGGLAGDSLTIVQEVSVSGADFNTSAVKIQTAITNNGAGSVLLGLRYLWDTQIGANDDGPTYQAKMPDGPVVGIETDYLAPAYDTFLIQDNNDPADFTCFGVGNSPFPFFNVQGSVNGPASLLPSAPTRLAYVDWLAASALPGGTTTSNAFDYTISGVDTSTCTITFDDSAVIYWWGDTSANSATVMPGATVTLTAYLFAHLPGTPPNFLPPGVEGPPGDATCSDGLDNDGDGDIDLDDADCIGSEGPPGDATCSDGIDNDGDGDTDLDDSDCIEPEGPPGDPTCSDGIDNDGDGDTDLDDPDCQTPSGNMPPDCSGAAPGRDELWPPNHKFREMRVVGVTDPEGDPVTVEITAITQDEPLDGKGDGHTCPDGAGIGTDRFKVRAERSGLMDGRVYHISFTAQDDSGGQCTGQVALCVPHDQRPGHQCVDQGPLFDSTGPCDFTSLSQGFYGAAPRGSNLITINASEDLGLPGGNPLLGIFTAGTLLPIDLGHGEFELDTPREVKGKKSRGTEDGGFLPGLRQVARKQGARNELAQETLTMALTLGLSRLGADSLVDKDIDGNGTVEDVFFVSGFGDLIINHSEHILNRATVEEALLFANEVLENGGGSVKRGNRLLSDFATLPHGTPPSANINDLITLLGMINSGGGLPGAPVDNFLISVVAPVPPIPVP